MSMICYIAGKKVDWSKLSLMEYLKKGYLPDGWEELFEAAMDDVFPEISELLQAYSKKSTIYPPMPAAFTALELLKPEEIRVVLIGQDPYHGEGEAMGLSFSVPEGKKIPPSLRNIYKELTDEGYQSYKNRKTGNLLEWSKKGVFLYNTCLTVNKGEAGSHKALWSDFTSMLISFLSDLDHIAWILLGESAKKLAKSIDKDRHGVFMAGHPSPLNTSGNFIGSGVFQKAQDYVNKHCTEKFSWELDE